MAHHWRPGLWAIVAAIGPGLAAVEARADRIVIRGGGQIKGKLAADPNHADRVLVVTERGKTPMSFQKSQVLQVIAEPSALDEYMTRREAAPTTAEGQYALGRWAESQKLLDLASVHYQAALKLDPAHAPAHRKLGHVLRGDRWLSGDGLRESQGLVKFKGKWITLDEKARLDKEAETTAEQLNWVRRIRLLRESILYSAQDRQREAEGQLLDVRDPNAIGPLVRVLGDDEPRLRSLLAHVLGAIPGPEATTALVVRLLNESDAEVRFSVMDELTARKESEVSRLLILGLRSGTPAVINRAAWGLSNLNAVSTVPNLVGALVTSQVQVVGASMPGGPAEGMGLSVTFGSVPPASAPIAYNGGSVGSLSDAAVGSGVAAYGASGLSAYPSSSPYPYLQGGYGPSPAGVGVNAGGGLNGARGPIPRVVRTPVRNVEVLSALVKLTGQDFGYDVDAWKQWVRNFYESEAAPARRVPQP